MQWEYKAIAIAFSGTTQLETELNDMGKDGWELVHFDGEDEPEDDGLFYANCVFKRPFQYKPGVVFGPLTVEGESGEIYSHYYSDPTLTQAQLQSALMQGATQQRGRGKPGARS